MVRRAVLHDKLLLEMDPFLPEKNKFVLSLLLLEKFWKMEIDTWSFQINLQSFGLMRCLKWRRKR